MKYLLLLAVCLTCNDDGRMDLVIKEYATRNKCEQAAAQIKRSNPKYRTHICIERRNAV